ncbi:MULTISPECIES: hypothetical protein [unclassified Streptomyces]|uniref:hypothetical protein n=1 Tax=unclassified Streptomyces TaxID=2593676 RepID=UPI003317893C
MTDAYALADTDPVAALLAWLSAHPVVTEALGGPGRVSGEMEPPWPHLRVTAGPGADLRDMTWLTEPDVSLELIGDPSGWPGPAAMRRTLLVCALAAKELVDTPHEPGQPVVAHIRPSGALIESPLANGQPRWMFGLIVSIHPPQETP